MFLAISSLMFLLAANFINGRQGKAEFRQGMNELDSKVRQVINDVSNGYYPSEQNFRCYATDTAGDPPRVDQTSSNALGTNKGCVFLGKVISFGHTLEGDWGYNIFTVVGRQYVGSQKEAKVPTKFSDARPKTVYTPRTGFSLIEQVMMKWGMKITDFYDNESGESISGLGFYTSFGKYETGNTLVSGSQEVITLPIKLPEGGDTTAMANAIDTQTVSVGDSPTANRNIDAVLCIEGNNGQWGTLKFGGNGGQRLTTRIQVYNNKPGISA